MKVASLSLLVLSLLAHRADSQSAAPTGTPTAAPSDSAALTGTPTAVPTRSDSAAPTGTPSAAPSDSSAPTGTPTAAPSGTPTAAPSGPPTAAPSDSSSAPTVSPAPECYTDLNEIFIRESAVFDSTIYREFILCANTEFVLRHQLTATSFSEGSLPLYPRRNTAYKCGIDGKSSNNCKLVGGTFQVVSFDQFSLYDQTQYEQHTNVTITGITFEAGFFGTALLGNAGDITFSDCIFREQRTIGSIYALYFRPGGRRGLGENFEQHSLISSLLSGGNYNQREKENKRTLEEQEELGRDLQLRTLDVIIINCVFEANIIAPKTTSFHQSSIIKMEYPWNRLEIYDTIFLNNLYDQPAQNLENLGQTLQELGSAVETTGPVTIENTCFVDNEFLKYAPVILRASEAVLTSSGNYGNVIGDEKLACDFAISFRNQEDFENMNDATCFNFTATECAATRTPEPTMEPTKAPVRTPRFTPYPTPRPTISPAPSVTASDSPSDAPTAAAAGRAIISLSAMAVALTAHFVR